MFSFLVIKEIVTYCREFCKKQNVNEKPNNLYSHDLEKNILNKWFYCFISFHVFLF